MKSYLIKVLRFNWRGIERLKQLFGFFTELCFDMFLQILVILRLINSFLIEIFKNLRELSWEGES